MRLIILSLIVFIFLSAGCKKRSHNPDYSDSIEGTWELRKIAGNLIINYPPGSGNLLKFTTTKYEIYASDTLYRKGTYSIVNDSMAVGMDCVTAPVSAYKRIIYDGKIDSTKESIEITNGTLKLISGCFAYDSGVEKQYVRK